MFYTNTTLVLRPQFYQGIDNNTNTKARSAKSRSESKPVARQFHRSATLHVCLLEPTTGGGTGTSLFILTGISGVDTVPSTTNHHRTAQIFCVSTHLLPHY